LSVLVQNGHEVICIVRDSARFRVPSGHEGKVRVIEADFLREETLSAIPEDIDAAYFLIHSMSVSTDDFEKLEAQAAENFRKRIGQTKA